MPKSVIYRIKDDIFHKFDSTSDSILPQSEHISAINDCVIVTFCMSVGVFAPLMGNLRGANKVSICGGCLAHSDGGQWSCVKHT